MLDNAIQALRRGDHDTARAEAEAVLAETPGDGDALRLRGLARFAQGDAEGARADIEAALERHPDRSELHMALSSMAMARGELDEALATANKAVEADPNHLPAYVSLAHLALARGDIEEARRFVALAQRVSATHPQTLIAQANLAQVLGEREQALALLVRVVEMLPEDRVALVSLAQAYLRLGHFAFAEQALRRVVELHGHTRRTRWALVAALRGQSHFQDALEEVDALLESSGDAGARAQRARLLLDLGRVEEAVEAFGQAFDELGPDASFVRDAVQGLVRQRRPDLARGLIDGLLERHGEVDLLWRVRVSLAPVLGEDPGAFVRKWLDACPASGQAAEYEAMRLEADGEIERADEAAQRALTLEPELDVAPLVQLRARVHNEPVQAIELADALLESRQDPEFRRTVLMWKGLAADELGRASMAVESWRAMLATATPLPEPAGSVDPAAAAAAEPDSAVPALFWGLPGSDVVSVAERFRGRNARVLLADRFSPRARRDGLDLRAPAEGAAAPTAQGWAQAIRGMGADPSTALDWLPHWSPQVDGWLPGNRLVCILRDPRDLLLNWWVYGTVQRYAFPGPVDAARWLNASLLALADRAERSPADTLVLRGDDFADLGSGALEQFLGLQPGALAPAPAKPPSFGGHALRFQAKHWQTLAAELKDAFGALAPSVQRLGYE